MDPRNTTANVRRCLFTHNLFDRTCYRGGVAASPRTNASTCELGPGRAMGFKCFDHFAAPRSTAQATPVLGAEHSADTKQHVDCVGVTRFGGRLERCQTDRMIEKQP